MPRSMPSSNVVVFPAPVRPTSCEASATSVYPRVIEAPVRAYSFFGKKQDTFTLWPEHITILHMLAAVSPNGLRAKEIEENIGKQAVRFADEQGQQSSKPLVFRAEYIWDLNRRGLIVATSCGYQLRDAKATIELLAKARASVQGVQPSLNFKNPENSL